MTKSGVQPDSSAALGGTRVSGFGSAEVDGRSVCIDWSSVGDDTMIITRGHQDHFMFLVILPQTASSLAHAAMAMAVRDDNDASAERILGATNVTPTDRTRVLPGVAAVQSAASSEPGHRAFYGPTVAAQTGRGVDASTGDAVSDATLA